MLKELQVHRVQMAIVIDEYSSFVGIVTVEDILEEIVGDIMDEYDKEEPEVQNISEGVFAVDAQIWVEDINEQTGDQPARQMNHMKPLAASSLTGSDISPCTRGKKLR